MRAKEKLAENIEVERRGASAVIRFALIPLAVILGIGIGIKFPNIFKFGQGSTKPSAERRPGVLVEKWGSGEMLLGMLGQNALVYKYTGGVVEFWLELDSGGETQDFSDQMKGESWLDADSNHPIEGYFIWVRGEADDSGHENWQVTFNQSDHLDLHLEPPLPRLVSQSRRRNETFSVQVWKRKKPEDFKPSNFEMSDGVYPISILKDREYRIMQITEQRELDGDEKSREVYEEIVIRVMCKAASNKRKTEKGETPGQ